MAGPFFRRLRDYYLAVASSLRNESSAAGVFANKTDIGTARESAYARFLRRHAPSKCNVFLGGFLFGSDGSESSQIDVIVTTDTAPRFDFSNDGDSNKSCSPVEGTLAIASIKSMLNKDELHDALGGIASIPPTSSLVGRVIPGISIRNYDDWPFKIVYATGGLGVETVLGHLSDYYSSHPNIPVNRRPDIIHVLGKYIILRAQPGMAILYESRLVSEGWPANSYRDFQEQPDLQGIIVVLNELQQRATVSTYILYKFGEVFDSVNRVST